VLVKEGYTIAGIDRRDDGLRSLAEEMPLTSAIADVTDPTGLLSIRDLEAKVGPIDLVVANAGIGAETSARLQHRRHEPRHERQPAGVSNTIGAVLPGMIQRRHGHVVASPAWLRTAACQDARLLRQQGRLNAIMDGLRVELQPIASA